MRKIITLAFAILCMISAFAADVDIIIKTNSEKIEALIQEVSDTEIRYKKANNPNGPMFVIKMDDVSTILYSNGEVQAVEHKAKIQQPSPVYSPYGYQMPAVEAGMMQRIGYNEYMIDGQRLKGKELVFFLNKNCPQAYDYYRKWNNCEVAGWSLFGIGIALAVGIGTPCFLSYVLEPKEGSARATAGVAFMAAGGAMTMASIPLIACGNVYKRRVNQVYNSYCGRQQAFQPELRLTSGSNGLGLALSF